MEPRSRKRQWAIGVIIGGSTIAATSSFADPGFIEYSEVLRVRSGETMDPVGALVLAIVLGAGVIGGIIVMVREIVRECRTHTRTTEGKEVS